MDMYSQKFLHQERTGKLQPTDPILLAACFCKQNFTGTLSHSPVCILSLAALSQRQNSVAAWPTKLNVFTMWPFIEKVCGHLFQGLLQLELLQNHLGHLFKHSPTTSRLCFGQGVGQDLRFCNPDESPGEADTASSRTTPGQPLLSGQPPYLGVAGGGGRAFLRWRN